MSRQDIDPILDALLHREGDFVDHPADRGGPTKFGITKNTLSVWRGRPVSAAEVAALEPEEARAIYRRDFIERPGLDTFPAIIAPFLVDAAVNHGPRRAVRLLQRVINDTRAEADRIEEDGIVGPATATAAEETAGRLGRWFLRSLVDQRRRFYFAIVAADPAQRVFLDGWLARISEFDDAGLERLA